MEGMEVWRDVPAWIGLDSACAVDSKIGEFQGNF